MEKNSFIKIDYVGRIKANNRIFDLTNEEIAKKEGIYDKNVKYGPKTIILGYTPIIKGLEKVLYDMKNHEERIVEIKAEEGFGKRDVKLIRNFPLKSFIKNNVRPEINSVVRIGNRIGRIIGINSGRVRVDFNHPLAGKDLIYYVKIVDVIEDDEGKIKAILEKYFDEFEFNISDNVVEVKIKENLSNGDLKKLEDILNEEIRKFTGFKKLKIITI